jgi:hypothetical protein
LAVLFRKALKTNANAVARIAVHDLSVHHDVVITNRDPDSEDRTLGYFCLRIHIEAAGADVFDAGNASRVGAIKEYIDNEAGAVETPSLFAV